MVQKLVDRLPGIVDTAGKVGRCHARSGQIILQLKTKFGGLGYIGGQKLLSCRVGESHWLFALRQLTNDVVNEPGITCGLQICLRIEVAKGGACSLGISARPWRWAISCGPGHEFVCRKP